MKILICNERFLFRFGVDRTLLILASFWRRQGHEIILMGNRLDEATVKKCCSRFIHIPEASDYLHGNEWTAAYIQERWDEWFTATTTPDIAFIAGWPFYCSIAALRQRCGCAVFHDYGAVPTEGMDKGQLTVQNKLRQLRKDNLRKSDGVIAISDFIRRTQSLADVGSLVSATCVLLGADHIDMRLWDNAELGIAQSDVLEVLADFRSQGYKVIFQPGRWESGNYKNSAASFDIVRKLKERGLRVKLMVLAEEADMEAVPDDIADSFYRIGFIDDATMRAVMESCDAGMLPTLWEGFDLPLAEMQYLGKHLYVFDIGAHGEVSAHPWFLCRDNDDMAQKLYQELTDTLPVSGTELAQALGTFRERFTWRKSADEVLSVLEKTRDNSSVLLFDVTNACHDPANTGVMRVTRKTAQHLQYMRNTVFILWDASLHKYVFPYKAEIEQMCAYGGPDAADITWRSIDGNPRTLLDDTLEAFAGMKKLLLLTETVASSQLRQVVPYMHRLGIYCAAIFYDAIAVLRPEFCAPTVVSNHTEYMNELSDCDLVLPTALHNERDMTDYWKAHGFENARALVRTVPLAGAMDKVQRRTESRVSSPKKHILFVSTLEPRKNHVRLLNAFAALMAHHPQLEQSVSLTLVGKRYVDNDELPLFVDQFCSEHKNTRYLGVVSDEQLYELYDSCSFTVYPSEIEGFGIPITESLWFAKPCLCSDSGSIGELATASSGCCIVNVLDEVAIERALYRLVTDDAYLSMLRQQAAQAPITTWHQYASGLDAAFTELLSNRKPLPMEVLSPSVRQKLRTYVADAGRRLLLCCNYYPPHFIGGAEIIAHNQAKALAARYGDKPVVFAMDYSGVFATGFCYAEDYEGIVVIRCCGRVKPFNGINFIDTDVDVAFNALCEIVRPDIVHCHNISGMSLNIITIAKTHGAAVLLTLHDGWGFCYKQTMLNDDGKLCTNPVECDVCNSLFTDGSTIFTGMERKLYFRERLEQVDAFISPSRYLAERYLQAGFPFHRMHVIWNGIDTKRYAARAAVPSSFFRITFVGFFGAHKGIDVLLEAISLIADSSIRLNLVGTSENEVTYREKVRALGIETQVRFWGKVDNIDILRVYNETDVYCLPSIWPENQPVSITEAMACGLPVIATNLGGVSELVLDGVTGFLFPVNDSKMLAAKIMQLRSDEAMRRSFGIAGRECMRSNDFADVACRLSAMYDSLRSEKVREA